MADYQLEKDTDRTITETVSGVDLTGATITWMLLPLSITWTAQEAATIDSIIQSGYRQFLHPPMLPEEIQRGMTAGYIWSFLSPAAQITTAVPDWAYDLPDDFGGMIGDLTLGDGSLRPPILERGEGQLRALHAGGVTTGKPTVWAIRPKASDGTTGQRWELLVWPIPDGIYTMDYRYNVQAGKLSYTRYPLGGMAHAETILASCLAVAERREDDNQGIHQAAWEVRLRASIAHDRAVGTPTRLGYNGDHSGDTDAGRIRARYSTYEGAYY